MARNKEKKKDMICNIKTGKRCYKKEMLSYGSDPNGYILYTEQEKKGDRKITEAKETNKRKNGKSGGEKVHAWHGAMSRKQGTREVRCGEPSQVVAY